MNSTQSNPKRPGGTETPEEPAASTEQPVLLAECKAVRDALAEIGVGEPKRSELAALPFLTAKHVLDIGGAAKATGRWGYVWGPGLMVRKLEGLHEQLVKDARHEQNRLARVKAEETEKQRERDADVAEQRRREAAVRIACEADRRLVQAAYQEYRAGLDPGTRRFYPEKFNPYYGNMPVIWLAEKLAPGRIEELLAKGDETNAPTTRRRGDLET